MVLNFRNTQDIPEQDYWITKTVSLMTFDAKKNVEHFNMINCRHKLPKIAADFLTTVYVCTYVYICFINCVTITFS